MKLAQAGIAPPERCFDKVIDRRQHASDQVLVDSGTAGTRRVAQQERCLLLDQENFLNIERERLAQNDLGKRHLRAKRLEPVHPHPVAERRVEPVVDIIHH